MAVKVMIIVNRRWGEVPVKIKKITSDYADGGDGGSYGSGGFGIIGLGVVQAALSPTDCCKVFLASSTNVRW